MARNNPRAEGFEPEPPLKPFDEWLVDNAFFRVKTFRIGRYKVGSLVDDDSTTLAVISISGGEKDHTHPVFRKEGGEWKLEETEG